MKFQVEKASLVQVLQRIQSATEKKTTMPILNNCLIKAAEDGTVEFSATDLELNLWTKIGAQVKTEGKTTASARKLLEIVREIPQDRISLEATAGSRLIIKAGRSRFELSTIPAEDFPNINLYQDLPLTSCDTAVLKTCASKDTLQHSDGRGNIYRARASVAFNRRERLPVRIIRWAQACLLRGPRSGVSGA